MSDKKISIIVPVYNVEDYVERCMLSIVSQQVSSDKYEIIVVNDGSTDNSGKILKKLQEQYPFIQIIEKENGGLSSARNEGVKHATGEYIFFLDSDDWISNDSLPFLLNQIEKFPVDILLFSICIIDEAGNKKLLDTTLSQNDKVYSIEDYLLSYTLRSCACQGLFARKLFTENSLQFKAGFLCEDDDFSVRAFSLAKKIVCNDNIVYYYYQRLNSISHDRKYGEKIIRDKLIMLLELQEYIQAFEGKLKIGLQRKIDFLAVDILLEMMKKNVSGKVINEILGEMKQSGFYPLVKKDYLFKYKLFRQATRFPFMVKAGRLTGRFL